MKPNNLNLKQEVAIPLLTLLFVSGVGAVLVGLRVLWTRDWNYCFLIWNLFLAWMPLVFAVGVSRRYRKGERLGFAIYSLAALWLLFFPNAPYIFTDLIHLTTWFKHRYWTDMSLILLFAFTGFLLGFMSLYLMQRVVADRFGGTMSWLFIMVTAGLGGFGIYLGRVRRWNSWDVVVDPMGIVRDMAHWVTHPMANRTWIGFTALFATFLFLGYLMLYALTHLQPAQQREVTN
ncbi:DUF1361 domain-containing protein [Pedosphaera parvula]|uniref:DUF1361 domain-containing protein n=1 Tax=Pedosphaera parvula (strain Ellin514) TaxID=320771 RepID=B9XIR6_PEDPL|nr:DUF1361 domain-containing protein [Pedosphaera parvula]EEF60329.1 protein of unknown function DUF1361 [Pedosphaera parvula Ellin514]